MLSNEQENELKKIKALRVSNQVHDVDFDCFKNMSSNEKGMVIVDVGANRGQSIVSFKSIFPNAKVLSFEANSFFYPILDKVSNWYSDIKIYYFGLGHTEQEIKFQVPVIDGRSYLEEGSTRADNFEKPWVVERLKSYGSNLVYDTFMVNIKRCEDVVADECIDIVKIDVEGAELDVLVAMDSVISKSKPIFLIENSDWENVTNLLNKKGYVCYQYLADQNKLVPLENACTNSFYIHDSYRGDLINYMTNYA